MGSKSWDFAWDVETASSGLFVNEVGWFLWTGSSRRVGWRAFVETIPAESAINLEAGVSSLRLSEFFLASRKSCCNRRLVGLRLTKGWEFEIFDDNDEAGKTKEPQKISRYIYQQQQQQLTTTIYFSQNTMLHIITILKQFLTADGQYIGH